MDPHDDFEEYVERVAKTYGVTIEEAKQLNIVQQVKMYYDEKDKDANDIYCWKE